MEIVISTSHLLSEFPISEHTICTDMQAWMKMTNLFTEITVHACNMFTHLKLIRITDGLLK